MADYANSGNGHGGLGERHGPFAGPWGACPYTITPNGGASMKGGEPNGPFGQYKETANDMMGVSRDSMQGAPGIQGGIATPMDTSKSEMPGVRGSDGTGPVSGGGAKISSPWSGPWGDSVG